MPHRDVEDFVAEHLPSFFVDRHVRTVVEEAAKLCDQYPSADREVVRMAAWLHDVGHTVFGGEYYQEGRGAATKQPGPWIREAIDSRGRFIEKGELHQERGARLAREYLNSVSFPETATDKVIHCIVSHRSSQPPDPATLEARIVASADNVSHLVDFDHLSKTIGLEKAQRKVQRDLGSPFMLPPAMERASRLYREIKATHHKALDNQALESGGTGK